MVDTFTFVAYNNSSSAAVMSGILILANISFIFLS